MKLDRLLILAMLISLSMAWWDTGHMLIAQIAQNELSAKSPDKFKRANELSMLLNFLSDNRSQDFIQSAAWPDDVRNQGFFFWDTWHGIKRPVLPTGTLFNFDAYNSYYNVVSGIESCRVALINDTGANFSEIAMMLRLAVHLFGDIHQPLHNAQLVNGTYPQGDQLGTQMFIKTIQMDNISLHEYWDRGAFFLDPIVPKTSRPLTDEMKQYIQTFAKNLVNQYPRNYFAQFLSQNLSPESWSVEGFNIANTIIYPSLKNTNSISEDLQFQFQRVSAERVTLAGYRLADWLNDNIFRFGV